MDLPGQTNSTGLHSSQGTHTVSDGSPAKSRTSTDPLVQPFTKEPDSQCDIRANKSADGAIALERGDSVEAFDVFNREIAGIEDGEPSSSSASNGNAPKADKRVNFDTELKICEDAPPWAKRLQRWLQRIRPRVNEDQFYAGWRVYHSHSKTPRMWPGPARKTLRSEVILPSDQSSAKCENEGDTEMDESSCADDTASISTTHSVEGVQDAAKAAGLCACSGPVDWHFHGVPGICREGDFVVLDMLVRSPELQMVCLRSGVLPKRFTRRFKWFGAATQIFMVLIAPVSLAITGIGFIHDDTTWLEDAAGPFLYWIMIFCQVVLLLDFFMAVFTIIMMKIFPGSWLKRAVSHSGFSAISLRKAAKVVRKFDPSDGSEDSSSLDTSSRSRSFISMIRNANAQNAANSNDSDVLGQTIFNERLLYSKMKRVERHALKPALGWREDHGCQESDMHLMATDGWHKGALRLRTKSTALSTSGSADSQNGRKKQVLVLGPKDMVLGDVSHEIYRMHIPIRIMCMAAGVADAAERVCAKCECTLLTEGEMDKMHQELRNVVQDTDKFLHQFCDSLVEGVSNYTALMAMSYFGFAIFGANALKTAGYLSNPILGIVLRFFFFAAGFVSVIYQIIGLFWIPRILTTRLIMYLTSAIKASCWQAVVPLDPETKNSLLSENPTGDETQPSSPARFRPSGEFTAETPARDSSSQVNSESSLCAARSCRNMLDLCLSSYDHCVYVAKSVSRIQSIFLASDAMSMVICFLLLGFVTKAIYISINCMLGTSNSSDEVCQPVNDTFKKWWQLPLSVFWMFLFLIWPVVTESMGLLRLVRLHDEWQKLVATVSRAQCIVESRLQGLMVKDSRFAMMDVGILKMQKDMLSTLISDSSRRPIVIKAMGIQITRERMIRFIYIGLLLILYVMRSEFSVSNAT